MSYDHKLWRTVLVSIFTQRYIYLPFLCRPLFTGIFTSQLCFLNCLILFVKGQSLCCSRSVYTIYLQCTLIGLCMFIFNVPDWCNSLKSTQSFVISCSFFTASTPPLVLTCFWFKCFYFIFISRICCVDVTLFQYLYSSIGSNLFLIKVYVPAFWELFSVLLVQSEIWAAARSISGEWDCLSLASSGYKAPVVV